jgi:hypothetical protein
LRQESGWHLDEGDTPKPRRGGEASQIPDHAAPQRQDKPAALEFVRSQSLVTRLEACLAFRTFSGRHTYDEAVDAGRSKAGLCLAGVKRSDFSISDDRAMAAQTQPGAFLPEPFEQVRPDADGITSIAERHLEAAHKGRIRVKDGLSKV